MSDIEVIDSVPTNTKKDISLSTGPTIIFFTALLVSGYLIGRGIEAAIVEWKSNRKKEEDE